VSQHVTDVVSQAAAALDEWWGAPVERRAAVLESIANALDGQVEVLSELAESETSLGVPRLVGEVARTTFQLRLFASALREGRILRPESDPEVSGSPPEGHAALARSYLPIGVVAVFGASNFPFAFGVLGGDSASALAAGCAVVVKVHPAHPRLSRRLIALAREAIAAVDAPQDLLTSVEGVQEGADLVVAREVKAVGFTGSQPAGRLLFDLASSRPDPIPFYGELSSLNPVAVTPGAARTRADEIAKGFAESLTLGAGQFCTKPAVVVVPQRV
jgi:NADP-dependent aldehyde dehydrogenase